MTAATTPKKNPPRGRVSTAGIGDTLALLKDVVLPTMAKGPLIRRRKVVGMAERRGHDDQAVERMKALRRKYGPGPLILRIPFRRQAVLLSAGDVEHVLDHGPEPFAPASLEKRTALAHFEPKVVLASHGKERADRRRFNEEVLETGKPVHSMADKLAATVDAEMGALAEEAAREGTLTWDMFFTAWYRMVRHLVLGAGARHDDFLTDLLAGLRHRGNYAFLRPKDRGGREELLQRIRAHLDRADPGSLAARVANVRKTDITAPEQQVPQWLFAFDPAGMGSFRTLALLATHPQEAARVRKEIAAGGNGRPPKLEFLRACLLESLRLWPTTPAILRETTRKVSWEEVDLPANTHILIFAPFFNRDDERFEEAHRFAPELWLDEKKRRGLALVPFSHGEGICPAVDFVPMVASLALARLLRDAEITLDDPQRIGEPTRLVGTLDNYTLSFRYSRRQERRAAE